MQHMITFAISNILTFMLLKFIMDVIAHYDFFTKIGWSYFWSRTAKEAPKTNWLHRYFPMFYDAWHFATFLEVIQVCILLSIPCDNIYVFPVLVTIGCIFFNILNDWASKTK